MVAKLSAVCLLYEEFEAHREKNPQANVSQRPGGVTSRGY